MKEYTIDILEQRFSVVGINLWRNFFILLCWQRY